MNELVNFNFEENRVRTTIINESPWFVLKDVCDILEIQNSRDVFKRLDEDEKGVDFIDTPGGKQEMQLVNEFGLYDTVIRSNSKKAKPFRRWITHEVIPAIRGQGYYSAIPPEQLAKALLDAMNDEWKLKNLVIPTMQAADVNQCMLVAQYMGLTADEFSNNPKLIKKSNKNLSAKNMIKSWERMGWKKYTMEDLPEEYRDRPQTMLAIEKTSKKSECYGWFAEYCGKMYFNRYGYEKVIEQMQKMGYITDSVASEWKRDLKKSSS